VTRALALLASFLGALMLVPMLVPMLVLPSCGPEVVRIDRTGSLALEFFWLSADHSQCAYYTVSTDGEFGSSGGAIATQRAVRFHATLSDADIVRFDTLVKATAFATRERKTGETGDRSEVVVVSDRKQHAFAVSGADKSLDELRAFCQEVAMRQFRDVIESQHEAGTRMR